MDPYLPSLVPYTGTSEALPAEPLHTTASLVETESKKNTIPFHPSTPNPQLNPIPREKKIKRSLSSPESKTVVGKILQFSPLKETSNEVNHKHSGSDSLHRSPFNKKKAPFENLVNIGKDETYSIIENRVMQGYLPQLAETTPGQFKIFNLGSLIRNDIKKLDSEKYKGFFFYVKNNEYYKIYLLMSDYAESLMQETGENLFNMIKDCEFNENQHFQKQIEIAEAAKKLWNEKNIEDQKKLINLLFREIYIETLLRKALNEFGSISKNLLKNETLDFSKPNHKFLESINSYTYKLLVAFSKLTHLSKDYKDIFCRFATKTIMLSTDLVNYQESIEESKTIATQMSSPVKLSKPVTSKLDFQTDNIRHFLMFFESEVLRINRILRQEQQQAFYSLANFFSKLKKNEFNREDLSSMIPLLENEISKNYLPTKNLSLQILELLEKKAKSVNQKLSKPLKLRLEVLQKSKSRSIDSSSSSLSITDTTDDDFSPSSSAGDEPKVLRRKSTKVLHKTIKTSRSPRKNSFGNTDVSFYLSSSSPREPFNAKKFYETIIFDPLIDIKKKISFLNAFGFYIGCDNENKPSEILFEMIFNSLSDNIFHLKYDIPLIDFYLKHDILLIVEYWLSNSFLNSNNQTTNENTKKLIKLIIKNIIDSNYQILKLQGAELLQLVEQDKQLQQVEPKLLDINTPEEILSITILKKSQFIDEKCVNLFIDTLKTLSIKNYLKINHLDWYLKNETIKLKPQNSFEAYCNSLQYWVLNLFCKSTLNEATILFKQFQDILLKLNTIDTEKGEINEKTIVAIDLASAYAIHGALKTVSEVYQIKCPELPSKQEYLENIKKIILTYKHVICIPSLSFFKKKFNNLSLLQNEKPINIEKISEKFASITENQKILAACMEEKKLETSRISSDLVLDLQGSFDILKTSHSYLNNTIIDTIRLNAYIESLITNDFYYKKLFLPIFKIFTKPLILNKYHSEYFLDILLQKFQEGDESRQENILQIVNKLLHNTIHFSKEKTSFDLEKKTIMPLLAKFSKCALKSTNEVILCSGKCLEGYFENKFIFKEIKDPDKSLGSPINHIKSIAIGKGKRGDREYDEVVANLATTFKQMSLNLIMKINSSELTTSRFEDSNAPTICALYNYYSNLKLWVLGLIVECKSKNEIDQLFNFFLNVIDHSLNIEKSTTADPVDFGSIIMIVLALNSCADKLWFPDNPKFLQKYREYVDCYGLQKSTTALREISDKTKFKIYYINLITGDLGRYLTHLEEDKVEINLSLKECMPLKILSHLFTSMTDLTYEPEIKIYDIVFCSDYEKHYNDCFEKIKTLEEQLDLSKVENQKQKRLTISS